ncbi:MAG: site-specific integrase [Candidatus Bathycorpusculaceae bacterium]
MKKVEYEKGFWRKFLGLSSDGWGSRFESLDLLLEHLRGITKSVASRDRYCYNLWTVCLWITKHFKSPDEKASQQVHNGHISGKGLRKSRNRWVELAEELNFDIINPDQLVSVVKESPERVGRLIRRLALEYFESGSFRYANNIIALANTFFKVNKLDLEIECFSTRGCSRLRKRQEYVPTLAEALRMADVAGSLRNRLIILFLTYSGLRNSTLCAQVYNEDYPDPLYKDHTIKKQLEREEKCLALIIHPVIKNRNPKACKNNVIYYAFIPPIVTEYLRLYLKEMEKKYGPLRDDQPIFHTENRRLPLVQRPMTPISARELQKIVQDAARRAGVKDWKLVTPHCLRKTFESFLRNQQDDVRLDVKDREFLMGHGLPGVQEAYYDKAKIEEMREKYARMNFEPVLRVEKEERVIGEDELQSFLQQGWHLEAILPSGKVVISRKSAIKQTEISVKSQNLSVSKKLEQTQQNNSQDIALNQPMQQDNSQEKNEDHAHKAKQSQNFENRVEEFKSKEEKSVKTLVSEQPALYSFLKTQQEVDYDKDRTQKKDQARINAFLEAKQASILDYLR